MFQYEVEISERASVSSRGTELRKKLKLHVSLFTLRFRRTSFIRRKCNFGEAFILSFSRFSQTLL